ncbi:DUF2651 family protein [Bacillus sp. UMB0893]|uniref:DUF2651 family protein n=1 Tax=Bacillus sp. UMB0893 TaxID=2066053 RepID=UPI000C76F532|nr:DUF2651 family protein [Bacillus sp. UMB0893]PLR66901.1 hypothetical protein CYJ36_16710 [Bacillus sp. UMB0893]
MEFVFVLIICPIIVTVLSAASCFLLKKWYIMPIAVLILFSVLTFTLFNDSFFIWVIVYTILSIVVSLIVKFIKKK